MSRWPKAFGIACLAAISTLPTGLVTADDWPTFRGVDRTGVAKETGLLQSWPKQGPPLLWKAEGVGRGYSSLAIADQRLFVLGDGIAGAEDTDEYLICHDRQDGRRLWATRLGRPWMSGNPTWQSSRSTPTVSGDFVYALTAYGELFCCDTTTGTLRWRKSLTQDFGGQKADEWGYSESVLVDGDQLICTPGGERTTVAALDKRTGKTLWRTVSPGDRGAAHGSIVSSEIGGVRVYVQTTGNSTLGIRARDGKLLWSYPFEPTTAVAATPIIRDDLVFFTVGYGCGGALLRQKAQSNGSVSIEEIYSPKRSLANKHGGAVLVGNHVFGDSEDAGIPFCADLMTGEIVWRNRASGRGSAAVAAADGRLYLHFADGTMVLAKADPKAYAEVGSFQVPHGGERPSWSHPVILEGKLYLREHNAILCFDIRERRASVTSP